MLPNKTKQKSAQESILHSVKPTLLHTNQHNTVVIVTAKVIFMPFIRVGVILPTPQK